MKTTAYTPFQVGARDRVVGFFVIAAVLLFLIGFLIPAVQRLSADEGVTFYTTLDQTYGIAVDAPVSLRGLAVGKVSRIRITQGGMVRVDISLSREYRPFYTNNSSLAVDSNIGVSTILTGSGLILEPGNPVNGLLDEGSFIPTAIPQGIGSILEELDLVQLTDQVTEIVANIEEVTAGLAQNQGKIYTSLDNVQEVTANVALVTQELPGMVDTVEQSLASLNRSIDQVNILIANVDRDLQATLHNSVALTEQATSTLAEAEVLFRETTPVMEQLPIFLITTDVALQSFTTLSDQLSRSWLLGGDPAQPVIRAGPSSHPHDDSLYIQDAVLTPNSQ